MQVYIYATEGIYQGLHGINWCGVVDVDSIEEANEWGYENAIDLISSYGLEREYEETYAMADHSSGTWYGCFLCGRNF